MLTPTLLAGKLRVGKLEAIGARLSGDGAVGVPCEREAYMVYATTASAPVFGLRREIDRLFEDTFGRNQAARSDAAPSEWTPAVDIWETGQGLTFAVELPGMTQEDVEVTAENGILTIRGQRTETRKEGAPGRYHLMERNYGSFVRQFHLPHGVDIEKIKANVENGMLYVHIPKAALPQPKLIHVTTSSSVNGRSLPAVGRGEVRPEADAPAKVTTARATNATHRAK